MSGICQSIESYYKNVVTTTITITDVHLHVIERRIAPVSRIEFFTSTALAILFLVQEIACLFFCCCESRSFCKKLQDIGAYAIAIPLGPIGMLFPQTVNAFATGIPPGGEIYRPERVEVRQDSIAI